MRKCIECGKEVPTSGRGLCTPCRVERMIEVQRQLQNKTGTIYEKWRMAVEAARAKRQSAKGVQRDGTA